MPEPTEPIPQGLDVPETTQTPLAENSGNILNIRTEQTPEERTTHIEVNPVNPDAPVVFQAIADSMHIMVDMGISKKLGIEGEDTIIAASSLAERILREEIGQREELARQGELSRINRLPFFRGMAKSLDSTLEQYRTTQRALETAIPELVSQLQMPQDRFSAISRAMGNIASEVFYTTRDEKHLVKRARFNPTPEQLDTWATRWKAEISSTPPTPTEQPI